MPRKRGERAASSSLCIVLRAADEAHRGHAVAVAVERLLGGLDQPRMIGQAEIVVGAEVQHLAAANLYRRRLGRAYDAFALVQALHLDLRKKLANAAF